MGRTAVLAVKIVGDSAGASKAFKSVDDDLTRMQSGFDGLVGPATVATAAIAAGAGYAAKAAGDLAEAQNKVDVVFGQSADQISSWAATAATSMGLSTSAALTAAGSFGTMFTQLGFSNKAAVDMSTGMVGLASDLASFHNVAGGATAVTDMMSAAMRGEYDSIQALIPTINANAVATQAMETTGKTSAAALTEQEKAAAAYQLILEGAGPAVGDFARTQDGAANSTRTAKASMDDAAAALGTALLPAVVSVTTALTALAGWMTQNQTVVLALTAVVAAFSVTIVAVKAATVAWTVAMNAMKVAIGLVTIVQWAWTVATNAYAIAAIAAGVASMLVYWPVLLIIAAIAAAIAVIVLIVKKWDVLEAAFRAGAAWLKNVFVGAWNSVSNAISTVVGWLKSAYDWVKKIIGGGLDKIASIIPGGNMVITQTAPSVNTQQGGGGSGSPRTNIGTLVYYGTGDTARDARALKRLLEAEDLEQGRSRGQATAVAW